MDLNKRVITWYLKEHGQRTDIPFSAIIQIEKAARDYKLLRMHHLQSPVPVRFHFPTASIREQFTQLLYYSHPQLNPTSSLPRLPNKPFLNLKIFVGTWNMCMLLLLLQLLIIFSCYLLFFYIIIDSVDPSPDDLAAWIPKDKDFYAIGTQVHQNKDNKRKK